MSLEKMGQSIESAESKVRIWASPEDVEKVKKSIEYSHHLTKANDVLKVLDFPDNQEEAFRKILLKQDNTILEELATKSKNEILTFLVKEQKQTTSSKENQATKIETEETPKQNQEQEKQNIKNERIEQKLNIIDSENSKKNSLNKPKLLVAKKV